MSSSESKHKPAHEYKRYPTTYNINKKVWLYQTDEKSLEFTNDGDQGFTPEELKRYMPIGTYYRRNDLSTWCLDEFICKKVNGADCSRHVISTAQFMLYLDEFNHMDVDGLISITGYER